MYSSLHNHTALGSNMHGFIDSMIRVEDLVNKAHDLGAPGVAITDHECLTATSDLIKYVSGKKKKDPDNWGSFQFICGNEIYLIGNKDELNTSDCSNFYHFILLAKDLKGYMQLTRLSTKAWVDNFFTHVIPRTPTFVEDLFKELDNEPGHLIGMTACLGSKMDKMILSGEDPSDWLLEMEKHFGKENFYLEMQSATSEEQTIVNKKIIELSSALDIPYVITCDSHYLDKEDREIHKSFLLSDDKSSGNREVDSFYESAYYQEEKDIYKNLNYLGKEAIELGLNNTNAIVKMCNDYNLNQQIVVPYNPTDMSEIDENLYNKYIDSIPTMKWFHDSTDIEDRHLIRETLKGVEANKEEYCNTETYKAIDRNLYIIQKVSENTGVKWSAYLLLVQSVVNTIWEHSLLGVGRGSCGGFILCKILGITQVNPLREKVRMFPERFLSPAKTATPDIDLDVCPEKRGEIFDDLKEQYGGPYHAIKVLTVSTAKSKKAIQVACRGLGYPNEIGTKLGSYIISDRGQLRSISQTLYGDEENDMAPDKEFFNIMTNEYPDVLKMALKLEGLPVGSSIHAGGIVLSNSDRPFTKMFGLMRTRAGEIVSCFTLHDIEEYGAIKIDLLATDCQTKLYTALKLLLDDGLIEWQGSLRATYEKYLGVYNIDRESDEIWDAINDHKIVSLFQFEGGIGYNCIEKCKPRNLEEMVTINSLMRLMTAEGETEAPIDRYVRMKDHPEDFYAEMEEAGLTKEEQKFMEKYLLTNHACATNQEELLLALQEPEVGGHDYNWCDSVRKSVSKKRKDLFEKSQEEFFQVVDEKNLSKNLCNYVWKRIVLPQRGYSFCCSHVAFYSIEALQEANIYCKYPHVYWSTAVLISDTGGEDSTVNYGKNAMTLSRMQRDGIKISHPDINLSRFDFRPLAKSNSILFGLKPIKNVGAEDAKLIVSNQPYSSMQDFISRTKIGNTTMISLIKSGAFDSLEGKPRTEIMKDFITSISKPITSLKMSNIGELIHHNLIPQKFKDSDLIHLKFKDLILTKENLVEMAGKSVSTGFYKITKKYQKYFVDNFSEEMKVDKDYKLDSEDGNTIILVKRGSLDKVIDKHIQGLKNEVLNNPEILKAYNAIRFDKIWADKCSGSISKWEMDSVYYYFSQHELDYIDRTFYGISDFFKLESNPVPITHIRFKDRDIPKYVLTAICGTVVDKDASHSTITLLTPTGACLVKFNKNDFNYYANTIVEVDANGKKNIIDDSWFEKGTKLIICGVRIDESFTVKHYKDTDFMMGKVIQAIELNEQSGRLIEQKEERVNVV